MTLVRRFLLMLFLAFLGLVLAAPVALAEVDDDVASLSDEEEADEDDSKAD